MRSILIIGVWLLLCLFSTTTSATEDHQHYIELTDVFSKMGEVHGWARDGQGQFAAGEDLFLLINGGAEIYHEYGFWNCQFQTYSSDDGYSMNVEIYEMDSPEVAYGIFTFKRSNNGTPVEIGQGSSYESYYIIFWKGRFLVTVIALGDWGDRRADIMRMANAFDAQFEDVGSRPRIASFLPEDNLRPNGITYLRGNLALFNQYLFDHEDIFGLKEGVIGRYEDHTVFVFQYSSTEESAKWYESAKDHLTASSRFDDFADGSGQFEISDSNNQRLTIKHFSNWILIVMTEKKLNTAPIFDSLKTSIDHAK